MASKAIGATLAPLSSADKRLLQKHETTIQNGMQSFVEVGRALFEIKEQRLHCEQHETFEAYCKQRWGFALNYANKMIQSSKAAELVGTIVPNLAPANEAQARVLAALPTEQAQADVWAKTVEAAPKAADGTPKITAALIKKVAGQVAELHEDNGEEAAEDATEEETPNDPVEPAKPAGTSISDANGVDLPTSMHPAFLARADFRAHIQKLGEIKAAVETIAAGPAGAFLAERIVEIKRDLGNAQTAIKFGMPHAICPYCNGKGCKPSAGLKAPCRGTGWVIRGIKGTGE